MYVERERDRERERQREIVLSLKINRQSPTSAAYPCSPPLAQKCTGKGIGRQGIVLKRRKSLQKSRCPVVICPY